jgi:amidase
MTLVFGRAMDATDLCFAGAAEQARLVAAGEVSARELVDASLERIWQADPELHAFRVVLAHRALTEADQAGARRGAGDRRPLLGVPVAIKDDTDVAGEVTAWGSLSHGGPR